MLRRLHHHQPESFAFTKANQAWADAQMAKYPPGRQASAVIPLLWRGQEQEGWVSRPMIEAVAKMLGLAQIRVLEVATFYFMFQLQPVGSVAHVQVCGTTSCMICGAEDLIAVCQKKIAAQPHAVSADGKFSWEEVECLGACANAPMAQIGKDYYEDLTVEKFEDILDAFARGEVPRPGPQNGRWASEPLGGLTSLEGEADEDANASVYLAEALGDTAKRIDGTEKTASDLNGKPKAARRPRKAGPAEAPDTSPPPGDAPRRETERQAKDAIGKPEPGSVAPGPVHDGHAAEPDEGRKPELLTSARGGSPDNLKEIKGVGPKLEKVLNEMGVYHFDQIAGWSADEVAWVDANLTGFKGRVSRDDWVAQAALLASGAETEFSKRVAAGEVASSKGDSDA